MPSQLLSQAAIERVFHIWQQYNAKPTTELHYDNPFQLLVAVILSAQTTDKSVNRSTQKLFQVIKKPRDLITLGEQNLIAYIRTIGLFRNKAKNLIAMAQQLESDFSGIIPQTREELMRLRGVGLKTANVILNTLYEQPVIAVDTHVFRLSRRMGLSNGATVEAVSNDLPQIIPEKYLKEAHHWLILHGRYTCTARRPKCTICNIESECLRKL